MIEPDAPKNDYGLREYSFEIGSIDDTSETVAIVGIEYSSVSPDEKFYRKEDVLKVIARLENELRNRCDACPSKSQENEIVAGLKAEVAQWKDKARHYPMMAALLDCDNRKTRAILRTLWLTRADRANAVVGEINNAIYALRTERPTMSFAFTYSQSDKWSKVERLCRKKADEYKEV